MTDYGRMDDAALLAGPDASGAKFAVFYRRHVQAVLGLLAQEGVDAWAAADVTAETFAAAALKRHRFNPRRGTARAWLFGIARNKLADSRRRWSRDRRLQERLGMQRVDLTESDVEAFELLRGPDAQEAMRALADLPAPQRAAVQARVLAERPYSEISRDLGISEVATRQHVSRGLAALRRIVFGKETS